MKTFVLTLIITAIQFSLIAQYNDSLKIDYFGQTLPGKKVQVFSPDFISRNGWYVQNCCFSQDGKEFVFCRSDSAWHGFKVMYTKYANGKWSEPVMLFPSEINLGMPFFSYDNTALFFSSSLKAINKDGDIYMSKRNGNEWEKPVKISFPVSSDDGNEWEISESRNGTLYYSSSRAGGKGMYDVWKSKRLNGSYVSAENLGSPINTSSLDECPYIASDESFLVFNSWKYNPKFKGNNLYLSDMGKDGKWTEPKDLGYDLNTDELDIYPYITPDGKYLMFTRVKYSYKYSERFSKIYWVDISVLDSVRKSKVPVFKPLFLTSEEMNIYTGIYSNDEGSLKLKITNEGNYLSASLNGSFVSIMEAIGKDTFWGHGLTIKFNESKGSAIMKYDIEVPFLNYSESITLTREK